ncbi:MAG: ABC transporter ATP-binding protein [Nitrospirae bacterium]|nr:ABC transporter ATP-binding protein [Nitrospirota bacterium]
MIEAIGLTHTYSGRIQALSDVSFTVEKGEIVGFLGPNGSGKTTTMKILTGLLHPTSGRARVAGFDVQDQPLEVKRRIGYLPEKVPLYKEMRVYDYLTFVAEAKGLGKGKKLFQVGYVMDRRGIVDRGDQLIGRLSKGYRQRVGLAQALLSEPEVLILDEPTEGLDPAQIQEIRKLIQELGRERTIILSTHILPEVSVIAGRVIILYKGKVVASDTPANLGKQLGTANRLILQVEGPEAEIIAALKALSGVTRVSRKPAPGAGICAAELEFSGTDPRREVTNLLHQRGWGLVEMRTPTVSLEEVFLNLVTEEGRPG